MTHLGLPSTVFWLLVLLGAYHGINPGMGWLFAVALGMQEQDGKAVAKALVPIALGHALAIGVVVLAAALLRMALPLMAIRYSVAAILVGLGIFSLIGHWHPRWVRMQVGFRDLTAWSFLVASAHGAGLMVLPVLLGSSTVEASGQMAVTITWLPPPALCQGCSPPWSTPRRILRSRAFSLGSSTVSSASLFFVRSGSISTWFGVPHSWRPVCLRSSCSTSGLLMCSSGQKVSKPKSDPKRLFPVCP